jgi:hypothetical protein
MDQASYNEYLQRYKHVPLQAGQPGQIERIEESVNKVVSD